MLAARVTACGGGRYSPEQHAALQRQLEEAEALHRGAVVELGAAGDGFRLATRMRGRLAGFERRVTAEQAWAGALERRLHVAGVPLHRHLGLVWHAAWVSALPQAVG